MGDSLKNIATRLGLSKTTISWVLSGQGQKRGIKAETQELVRKCAAEMNYQPNLLAKSLRDGSSKTIGLIVPSINDSFYSGIAEEIEKEALRQGYSLMIGSSDSKIEQENAMIRLFTAKMVDGIIIAPTKISKREISSLAARKFPLVQFDRYFPELEIDHVIIDNEQASYALTKALAGKGCRNIAIITTNPHLLTMDLRREGYANALADAGLKVNQALYGEVPYFGYRENIVGVLDRIFETVPEVDGFFFTTHILAIEALRYFRRNGIDPTCVDMACMHHDQLFRLIAPEMAIAEFPVEEISRRCVKLLMERINAEPAANLPSRGEVVPCRIDL